MKELKSKGCVTVRDTENRLSCMDIKLLEDRFAILPGENGNQIISHIPREKIISLYQPTPYTWWRLNVSQLNNCYTDFAICLCVYEPRV